MSRGALFWVVWSPGRPPAARYERLGSATKEAERLALANPGQEFIVLAAVCGFVSPTTLRTDYLSLATAQAIVREEGIPF